MEDSAAVERLKRGDAGGLESLVRRHHDRALRVAYLVVRDQALAEDVVQGSFVKAFEKIGGFDEGRPFAPWFAKIVVNDAIDAARRREKKSSREIKGAEEQLVRLADPDTGPHESAERSEASRRVWRAMEQLPPAQRAAIVERYYLGMSEAEMAESAASPPGTIKSRLSSARRRLAELLGSRSRATEAPAPNERRGPIGAASGYRPEEERP